MRSGQHHEPAQNYAYYENGPVNGSTDAWTVNFGFSVTNSLQLNSTVQSISFYAWVVPGDVLQSVDVWFGSDQFGGDLYQGTVNLTQSSCLANQFGFYVCLETATITNGPGISGPAWMTLQNATVNNGDPAYWDENSGIGCSSDGCPSQAAFNSVGTIPSEAFTVQGYGPPPPPPCFHPGGNLSVLHDFTTQEGPASGVTMDRAENLYGTTNAGGGNGYGLAYKLARAADWRFQPMYSFLGGSSGGHPTDSIVGPDGGLYGVALGGPPNCNGGYCPLVFNLKPSATVCFTALCGWTGNVIYQFTSTADGWGPGTVGGFDSAGNLYGTTEYGGDYGYGTVFKLMRSGGIWTKTVLYSFLGGKRGGAPTQVLVGNDGNLYGLAGGGIYSGGIVFQLTPAGQGWTQSILHQFTGGDDGSYPSYLVQDSSGNLYGTSMTLGQDAATIFMLDRSGGTWAFSTYHIHYPYGNYQFLANLTVDSTANLYGTGYGITGCQGSQCNASPDDTYNSFAYIFKASHGSSGWQYRELAFFGNINFPASGPLAIDAEGNLYGTTTSCGLHNAGTVWQLSP
jgi:uncharacterized repeat protein (TIGR03803 family)